MPFPWERFRFERLALLLVALTMLTVVNPINTQDHTRLALSESILFRGSLNIDPWHNAGDRAFFGGHWYTDKAPGLSLFALPEVAVGRAVGGAQPWAGTWRRALVRLCVNGPMLLGLCLLLGRMAEGLVPRSGTLAAVTTGVGTLFGPLAGVLFDHDGTAFLALAAFALAWRRRHLLAGAAAGAAFLWETQAALALAIVAAYALTHGLRPLRRYLVGTLPAFALLGAYDWIAFGSPFHLSYRYVADSFTGKLGRGFFGTTVPTPSDFHAIITGGSRFGVSDGLLVTSPVLAAAAAGLVLLWRRRARTEAVTCAVVTAVFLAWDAGYVAPYGGQSPGPRFAATGLGFLLVGLPLALERFRAPTLALVLASLAMTTSNALAWALNDGWQLHKLPATIWSLAGVPRAAGTGICCAFAAAAATVALVPLLPRAPVPAVPRALGLP